jgi:hypothetical protein
MVSHTRELTSELYDNAENRLDAGFDFFDGRNGLKG